MTEIPLLGPAERRAERRENVKMAFEAVAIVISAIAIYLSASSVAEQRRLTHKTASQTMIHDQYELCRVLDQLRIEHPEISHLLALPAQAPEAAGNRAKTWATYDLFKEQARLAMGSGTDQETTSAHALYLKEHAVALNVFDIYEQTIFQAQLATTAGDNPRKGVLDLLAKYYEGRMLRNPRLRFHWDHGGSDMMEADTRARYDREVRSKFTVEDFVDDNSPLDPK